MSCDCSEVVRVNASGCRSIVKVNTGLRGPAGPTGPQGPQGPPGPAGGATGASTFQHEAFTIDSTIIANKYVTLTLAPSNAENLILVYSGFVLSPFVDYTWNPGNNRVTFADALVARFTAGEQIVSRRLTIAS